MPTVLLVHEGSLRRVGDALPDGDGLGVAGVHGFHFLTVPPIPTDDGETTHASGGDVRSGSGRHPSLPAARTCNNLTADLASGKTAGPKHRFCFLPYVCEHWVCYCAHSQSAKVNKKLHLQSKRVASTYVFFKIFLRQQNTFLGNNLKQNLAPFIPSATAERMLHAWKYSRCWRHAWREGQLLSRLTYEGREWPVRCRQVQRASKKLQQTELSRNTGQPL